MASWVIVCPRKTWWAFGRELRMSVPRWRLYRISLTIQPWRRPFIIGGQPVMAIIDGLEIYETTCLNRNPLPTVDPPTEHVWVTMSSTMIKTRSLTFMVGIFQSFVAAVRAQLRLGSCGSLLPHTWVRNLCGFDIIVSVLEIMKIVHKWQQVSDWWRRYWIMRGTSNYGPLSMWPPMWACPVHEFLLEVQSLDHTDIDTKCLEILHERASAP